MLRPMSVAICCLLVGCSAVYPLVPNRQTDTIIDDGKTNPLTHLDHEQARHYVAGMKYLLDESIRKREKLTLAVQDAVFIGTVISVGGAIKDSRAAINTGAVLATLAELFTGRYQTNEQKLSFIRARDKLRCIERSLAPIEPALVEFVAESVEFQRVGGDYRRVPDRTVEAVEVIDAQLRQELAGIALKTTTLDQVSKVYLDRAQAIKDSKLGSGQESKSAISVQAKMLNKQQSYKARYNSARSGMSDVCAIKSNTVLDPFFLTLICLPPEQLTQEGIQFIEAIDTYEENITVCIAGAP